jgi:hypothetical protein
MRSVLLERKTAQLISSSKPEGIVDVLRQIGSVLLDGVHLSDFVQNVRVSESVHATQMFVEEVALLLPRKEYGYALLSTHECANNSIPPEAEHQLNHTALEQSWRLTDYCPPIDLCPDIAFVLREFSKYVSRLSNIHLVAAIRYLPFSSDYHLEFSRGKATEKLFLYGY